MSPLLLPRPAAKAHVVVVGAGGIGCPAAWALAEAGVGRLTLVDPDRVALSNLPRQILYGPADVGQPKAAVAADRLGGISSHVHGVVERLDDANEARLVTSADVLVDATDGALTKDWLNALAVRHDVPLVHAAGVRAEGRILDVPSGGRPCLACLFGRLEGETGTCADLGVWGGVVGAVGFLAASTALWRLGHPQAPSQGYAVLDLGGGRAVTLGAGARADCPVCGERTSGRAEPFPDTASCAAECLEATRAGVLDLTDEVCPMNLLRARQAVEALAPGEALEIRLGAEGQDSVPEGLRALGHPLEVQASSHRGLRLRVRRGRGRRGAGPPLDRDELLRFSRQVVLPEVGERGQRALLDAEAVLVGHGPAFEVAAVYLAAAGLGALRLVGPGPLGGPAVRFPCAETEQHTSGVALASVLDARSIGRIEAGDPAVAPGAGVGSAVGADDGGGAACHVLRPAALAFEVATLAGGGRIRAAQASDPRGEWSALWSVAPSVQRALGAMLADTVCRAIVLGRMEPQDIVFLPDGRIASESSVE